MIEVSRLKVPRFVRFSAIGASSTLLSTIVFNIVYFVCTNVPVAVVISFAVGAVNGSYWHRRWTFSDRRGESGRRQALKFFVVSTISCVLTTLVSAAVLTLWPIGHTLHHSADWTLYWSIALGKGGPRHGTVAATVAALSGGLLSMGWSYTASHLWAFRK